jgi:hypothetical protein
VTIGGEVIRAGQIGIRLRLPESQTGARFTMFESLIPVDALVPISSQPGGFRRFGRCSRNRRLLESGRRARGRRVHSAGGAYLCTMWRTSVA